MATHRIDLRLNGPQLAAHAALFDEHGRPYRRRTVFTGWGRGCGKSWYRRQVWYLLIALYDHKLRLDAQKPFRGVRITSLAPTLKQWKQIHWEGICAELGPGGDWAWLGAKLDKQAGTVSFPGGSRIVPFPASAYNAQRARGMRTDVLDADELDDIDAAVYDAIAIPWLSEPWSLGIELIGGTPTRGRHGLWYRSRKMGRLGEALRDGTMPEAQALELEETKAVMSALDAIRPEDWPEYLPDTVEEAALLVLRSYYGFHATYLDAPEVVSPLAVARARATTPAAVFKREWEADPDAGEGLVYPFDEDFHIIGAPRCPMEALPPMSRFREWHVPVDFGFADPGVMLRIGVLGHGEDATSVVVAEHYDRELPNHVWDKRAKDWRDADFWPDPSRADRAADFRGFGLRLRDVDNSIAAGIGRVSDMLFIRHTEHGGPWSKLYVAPGCVNTIREFGLYKNKQNDDGTFSDEPVDRDNHAMDALRYFALGRFGMAPNFRHQTSGR